MEKKTTTDYGLSKYTWRQLNSIIQYDPLISKTATTKSVCDTMEFMSVMCAYVIDVLANKCFSIFYFGMLHIYGVCTE